MIDDFTDAVGEGAAEVAETLLEGFVTGGLSGLLEALDAQAAASPDEDVDDPEALRRAEEAVAHRTDPFYDQRVGPQEEWKPIASQSGEPLLGGLQIVALALQAAGVPSAWDPYDPRDAPAFLPPVMGTTGRTFAVVVPASQVARAREALCELRPAGVAFVWDEPRRESARGWDDVEALTASEPAPAAEADLDFAVEQSAPVPTLVTGVGGPLSDNERLQRPGGTRPSGTAAILAVIGGLLAIGAAAYVLMQR